MALMANREASISSSNCQWGLGGTKTGLLVMAAFSALMALVASSVHLNIGFFLVRSVRGLAILVKFLMNGLWYLTVPRNFCTSLTDLSVSSYSLIPAILLGSMEISPFLTCIPRKFISGCLKTHFSGWR